MLGGRQDVGRCCPSTPFSIVALAYALSLTPHALFLFLFFVSDRSCVSKTMPNNCLAETRSIQYILCLYSLHGGRSQINGIWSHLNARNPLRGVVGGNLPSCLHGLINGIDSAGQPFIS
ncbi:hypothetical protein CGRA01v4_13317 [Colletotrichum graminicola]|nr:hypothetical protein CGRA01v4_13317 [Colletotrichum graminicola]